MEDIKIAIGRIERAISRLEQTDARHSKADPADQFLQSRHAQLKSEVAETIAELDVLLGSAARDSNRAAHD